MNNLNTLHERTIFSGFEVCWNDLGLCRSTTLFYFWWVKPLWYCSKRLNCDKRQSSIRPGDRLASLLLSDLDTYIWLLVYNTLNGVGQKHIPDLLLHYVGLGYICFVRSEFEESAFAFCAPHAYPGTSWQYWKLERKNFSFCSVLYWVTFGPISLYLVMHSSCTLIFILTLSFIIL